MFLEFLLNIELWLNNLDLKEYIDTFKEESIDMKGANNYMNYFNKHDVIQTTCRISTISIWFEAAKIAIIPANLTNSTIFVF